MLLQEVETDLEPVEVVRRAREFFTTRFSPYATFVESQSDSHIVFRSDAGELVIGTERREERTLVRGSTSRLHHELSQFLLTLSGDDGEVRQSSPGPGVTGAG